MPRQAPEDAGRRGVICSGNIVYDTLVRSVETLHWGGTTFVDSIECHVGGNGANTARALGRLGVPVRLLSAVGNDEQGCFILRELERDHVDVSRVEQLPTATASTVGIISPEGDRKFFHNMGASRNAFAQPILFGSSLCEGMAHYHMASLFVLPQLRAYARETLAAARSAGLTTSFDTNWDPRSGWMQTLAPCLPHIDFLFMNEEEAEMITGSKDPAIGAKIVLDKGLTAAVMKLSRRGCAIYTKDEEFICPAFDVVPVDTTGAGDSFVAGFLAGWLGGASLAESGRLANAVAALGVQKMGAVTGLLPRPETEAWMKNASLRGA